MGINIYLDKIILVNLLIVTLFTGCALEKDSIIISPLPKVNNQFIPSLIWRRSVGNGIGKYYSHLSPSYDEGVVYAADRKGMVKAMDINSGDILWSINLSKQPVSFFNTHLPALLSGGLTVSEGTLYIGTESGKVIALNKLNGKMLWEAEVFGEALSKPVVTDNLVLIHTSNGILQALDAKTGANKWAINLGSAMLSVRGKSTPAITHGLAVIGSNAGRITGIILSEGQIAWQQYISQIGTGNEVDCLHDVNMTPIIDISSNSGTIYALAYNGDLVAMNMHSAQIIWKREFGSVNDIILFNDIIYLVDQNDRVLAVQKSNGVTLWEQDALLHRHLTAPVIYDDYLLVGDGEGYLHWLNTKNGKFVVQNKIDSSGLSTRPVIAGDKLLLQAKNGVVYLIKH